MRKILLFLCVCSFSFSLAAQSVPKQVLDSIAYQSYNGFFRTIYSTKLVYDDYGIIHQAIHYNEYDTTEYYAHTDYIYNLAGNITTKIKTQDSGYQYKAEYTYTNDGTGSHVQEIEYSRSSDTEAWRNRTKRDYFKNENDLDISKYYYDWDSDSEEWFCFWASDFSYNSFGKIDKQTLYPAPCEGQVPHLKYDYVYDSDERLIEKIRFNWDALNDNWTHSAKIVNERDDDNNTINRSTYFWNNDTSDWYTEHSCGSLTEYTYDNSYAYEDIVLPNKYTLYGDYSEEEFTHARTSRTPYMCDLYTFDYEYPTGRDIYYYTEKNIIVGTFDVEAVPSIAVFPIPANDFVVFDINDVFSNAIIKIYDSQGKIVLSETLTDTRVSTSDLNTGAYFYQLYHREKMHSGKIIIQK